MDEIIKKSGAYRYVLNFSLETIHYLCNFSHAHPIMPSTKRRDWSPKYCSNSNNISIYSWCRDDTKTKQLTVYTENNFNNTHCLGTDNFERDRKICEKQRTCALHGSAKKIMMKTSFRNNTSVSMNDLCVQLTKVI